MYAAYRGIPYVGKTTDHMLGDEHGDLAISYYVLYTKLVGPPETAVYDLPVWVEDEWTEEDEFRARQRIAETDDERYRCKEPQDDALAWNNFYDRHQANFFKDRHYLLDTFPAEFEKVGTLIEIGCGVGNAALPFLERGWTVIGIDLSETAISILRKDQRFIDANGRAFAEVVDISRDLPNSMRSRADVSTLLFCLSAMDPKRQAVAVQNAIATLKPGGVIIIRDYGRYDQAQFQLNGQRSKRLLDNYYQKEDGTKVYYFSIEDIKRLFQGLETLECRYLRRVYRNRACQQNRRRVWVQARFQKFSAANDIMGK